jgi:hypothetical protein
MLRVHDELEGHHGYGNSTLEVCDMLVVEEVIALQSRKGKM